MAIVELVEAGTGRVTVVEAEGRLLDVCDEIAAPILFSCRSANCGICRVEVAAGAELLEPADEDERETLDAVSAEPSQRLACQVRLRATRGVVRLISRPER